MVAIISMIKKCQRPKSDKNKKKYRAAEKRSARHVVTNQLTGKGAKIRRQISEIWETHSFVRRTCTEERASSRDDAIFSGERHFWCESLIQWLKSPWALFLTKRVPEVSKSVPLIGQKNIFLADQRGDLVG